MKRRKFAIGLGSLAAGGAAVMGTGAFTQISAKRDVSGSNHPDNNAQLGLDPDGQNEEYASIDSNGELTLSLDALNPDSRTTLGGIFRITNGTGEKVNVWIQDNTSVSSRLTFVSGDPPSGSIEGSSNAHTLAPGDSLLVGVDLDLHGTDKSFSFGSNDNFYVVAETPTGGGS